MLFNSLEFLIFLPIVFLLYWGIGRIGGRNYQNILIVAASYLFYGWWDWRFLLLIAFTTFASYTSGILIEQCQERKRWRLGLCITNVILNLAILCYFKYCNFFGENFVALCNTFGWDLDWVTLDILLPVGISFYTFQALSYTIDVYRQKMTATRDIVAFFAFISFFPQLVAGPIERATNLLPQFLKPSTFVYVDAVDGLRQMLWGFFKKIVVADNCALAVNLIFDEYQTLDSWNLLAGAFFFTFQIYGDFSGYSDIAIGTAKLFGINLMRNFNYPYFSRDIAEFWRRWHISLTTWFRDYIYIPLGGSRCSRWKVMRNTMIIFLVSGFWHGANWTFIVWGIYHALLFFPLLYLGKNRKNMDTIAMGRQLPSPKEALQTLTTFILVMIGWIVFRAENIGQAWEYLVRMFTNFSYNRPIYAVETFAFIFLMLIIEWFQRNRQHGLQINGINWLVNRTIRWAMYYILLIGIILLAGKDETFIYFQF